MLKLFKEKEVPLPITKEGLDEFVASTVVKFDLPNSDDTYESIATLIMHMPQNICKAPLSFFGNSVLKSMANKVAWDKLVEFRERRQQAETPVEVAASEQIQVSDT